MTTAEQINNAIAWYRRYGTATPAEPFQLSPAVTITDPALWLTTLEFSIGQWERGEIGVALARAYVLRPLQMLRDWLKAQALEAPVITKETA
ncbi:MAG TPA: hypothetical protein V6D06_14880 [Trichocoleus sp.]